MSRYEFLAAHLRGQILSAELKAGDALPSISQLVQMFNVSYGTIRSAMLVLKAEGLVVGQQGVGVFVAER